MTIIGAYSGSGPNVVAVRRRGAHFGGLIPGLVTAALWLCTQDNHPVVIGPTIGHRIFLANSIQYNAANYWPVSLIVVACVFIFSLMSRNRFMNIFAVLASISIAYLVCLFGSLTGLFPAGHAAYVSLEEVRLAPWFRFNLFMPWGPPRFSFLAFGAIIAGFFAVMIESIGDYHSCSYASGLDDPDADIAGSGLKGGLRPAGFLGAVGTTLYTENVGLSLTGVASCWVVRTGRYIIIMGMIGKLGALIATVPSPLSAGHIALFGIIGALGIQVS